MILKYIKQNTLSMLNLLQINKLFSQPPKKRTQAPKYVKNQKKVDPKNIDYRIVPQQLRKGVKAVVEAKNMMVASEAQLEAASLREIILEERLKLQSMLNNIESYTKSTASTKSMPKQVQKEKSNNNEQNKESKQNKAQPSKPIESISNVQQKNYDFITALRFMSNISNTFMVANITSYLLLISLNKYSLLGFALGGLMNPSIIALTGLSIGFNCAAWIVRQSLHLEIKDTKQLTLDKISLTGSPYIMVVEALGIALQIVGLSYYLMYPDAFTNFPYLISSFLLSQLQFIFNLIRATGGYRFQFFSKLLMIQIIGSLLIGSLTYTLFNKINIFKRYKQEKYLEDLNDSSKLEQFEQISKGYDRFMSEFKIKNIEIVASQKINFLTAESQ